MKKNFFIFFVNFLFFILINNATAGSSDPKQFIQEIVDQAKKSGEQFSELLLRILTKIDQL